MSPLVRNIVAVVAGLVVGSLVNIGLVLAGGIIIPPPAGADPATMEGLSASMHLFEPRHFVMPFLAHALGTLAGAGVAAAIAVSHRLQIALGIGCLFLVGGILAAVSLPAPAWFIALDLVVGYLPMAWLGWKLAVRLVPEWRVAAEPAGGAPA